MRERQNQITPRFISYKCAGGGLSLHRKLDTVHANSLPSYWLLIKPFGGRELSSGLTHNRLSIFAFSFSEAAIEAVASGIYGVV
jgi:hypothetical protein